VGLTVPVNHEYEATERQKTLYAILTRGMDSPQRAMLTFHPSNRFSFSIGPAISNREILLS